MAVDRPEAIDPHPKGWNAVEGGRERLSCRARNGGDPGSPLRLRNGVVPPGEESRDGRCGDKSEMSEARSAFGQTSYIEDAGGRARREDNRNEDRRLSWPFSSGDGARPLTTSPTTRPVTPGRSTSPRRQPDIHASACDQRGRKAPGSPRQELARRPYQAQRPTPRSDHRHSSKAEGSGTSDPAPSAASPIEGGPQGGPSASHPGRPRQRQTPHMPSHSLGQRSSWP